MVVKPATDDEIATWRRGPDFVSMPDASWDVYVTSLIARIDQERERADRLERENAELRKRLEAAEAKLRGWKLIAEGRGKLNTCYRVGTQRGASKGLDMVRRGQDILKVHGEAP